LRHLIGGHRSVDASNGMVAASSANIVLLIFILPLLWCDYALLNTHSPVDRLLLFPSIFISLPLFSKDNSATLASQLNQGHAAKEVTTSSRIEK